MMNVEPVHATEASGAISRLPAARSSASASTVRAASPDRVGAEMAPSTPNLKSALATGAAHPSPRSKKVVSWNPAADRTLTVPNEVRRKTVRTAYASARSVPPKQLDPREVQARTIAPDARDVKQMVANVCAVKREALPHATPDAEVRRFETVFPEIREEGHFSVRVDESRNTVQLIDGTLARPRRVPYPAEAPPRADVGVSPEELHRRSQYSALAQEQAELLAGSVSPSYNRALSLAGEGRAVVGAAKRAYIAGDKTQLRELRALQPEILAREEVIARVRAWEEGA